jgi:group I intron endonuclease
MDKIYCITNKINGKKYIGFTTRTLDERMCEHFSPSSHKSGYAIHRAIKKYGKENFEYSLLYEGDDALDKEDYFINYLTGEYNMTSGGNLPPSQLGNRWKHTEESKLKMSLSSKGKAKSDSHRQTMSETRKGRIPWNKGQVGKQESIWKGQRKSPSMKSWKITRESGDLIVENLILWCEENSYTTSTVKYHLYKNSWPYKDIINIEKMNK